MRRTALALAGLLFAGGLVAGCGGDDSDEETPVDPTESVEQTAPGGEESPGEPTDPETSASTPSGELTSGTSPAAPRTGPHAEFCTNVDAAEAADDIEALRPVVAALVETLPDEASQEAQDGLDFLHALVLEVDDFNGIAEGIGQAPVEQQELVNAYGAFEREICQLQGP